MNNTKCPRCGGVNLKWAPHRAIGCSDCGWEANASAVDLSAFTDGGAHKLYPGLPSPEKAVRAYKYPDKPLMHYEFPAYPELKDGYIELTRCMSTHILDTMDKRIVDAVIEEAHRLGATDVFVLDRKWVMDALREKAEREHEVKTIPVSEIRAYLQRKLDEWNALGDRRWEPANMWGYNFIMACFDDLARLTGILEAEKEDA